MEEAGEGPLTGSPAGIEGLCPGLLIFVPFLVRFSNLLNLSIRESPKQVLLQTMKTQMKCSIMLHFIRVYTVCKGKKDKWTIYSSSDGEPHKKTTSLTQQCLGLDKWISLDSEIPRWRPKGINNNF